MTDLQKADDKKRVLIQLRTNKEDKQKLKEFAKTAGMSITDFVKARTLEKPPKRRVATYDREVLIKLLAMLGKIGSNLNQMSKAMNDKTFYSVTIKEVVIVQALEEVRNLSSQILNELNRDSARQNAGQREPIGDLPDGASGK